MRYMSEVEENKQGAENRDVKGFWLTVMASIAIVICFFAFWYVLIHPVIQRSDNEAAEKRITFNRTRPLAYDPGDPETKQLAEVIKMFRNQYGQTVDRNTAPITIAVQNKNGLLYAKYSDIWSEGDFEISTEFSNNPTERTAWITQTAGPRLANDLFQQAEPRPVHGGYSF